MNNPTSCDRRPLKMTSLQYQCSKQTAQRKANKSGKMLKTENDISEMTSQQKMTKCMCTTYILHVWQSIILWLFSRSCLRHNIDVQRASKTRVTSLPSFIIAAASSCLTSALQISLNSSKTEARFQCCWHWENVTNGNNRNNAVTFWCLFGQKRMQKSISTRSSHSWCKMQSITVGHTRR